MLRRPPRSTLFPYRRSSDLQYLNALHFGDAALGKFLDGLKSRGLDTNTIFVIHGDHGEAFGQHEGNYGHTRSEEHTSELQSLAYLVCRLLLEKKKKYKRIPC